MIAKLTLFISDAAERFLDALSAEGFFRFYRKKDYAFLSIKIFA